MENCEMSSATIVWILSRIDSIIRDYPAAYNTLKAVCAEVQLALEQEGHTVQALGRGKLSVDGELFRIYRMSGWSRYDVRNIAG